MDKLIFELNQLIRNTDKFELNRSQIEILEFWENTIDELEEQMKTNKTELEHFWICLNDAEIQLKTSTGNYYQISLNDELNEIESKNIKNFTNSIDNFLWVERKFDLVKQKEIKFNYTNGDINFIFSSKIKKLKIILKN
ncbi:MAG: hypothetical protein ACRCUM_03170 [Mycoplasmoidaceae bacterium]